MGGMRRKDREFFRELMREERRLADRRHLEWVTEFERQREEMRQYFAREDKKLDQIIADGEAGRAALFAILDRLDNGGGAAAAG
jgi:hypothetical protein